MVGLPCRFGGVRLSEGSWFWKVRLPSVPAWSVEAIDTRGNE